MSLLHDATGTCMMVSGPVMVMIERSMPMIESACPEFF